jgi:hypothetical protein
MLSAAGEDFGPAEFVILPLKLPGNFDGMLGQKFFEHRVVGIEVPDVPYRFVVMPRSIVPVSPNGQYLAVGETSPKTIWHFK